MGREEAGQAAKELEDIISKMEKQQEDRMENTLRQLEEEGLVIEDLDLEDEEAAQEEARKPDPERGRDSFFKPADGLAVAFWVPVVVMVIIFIQRGIFPFGEESFLRTDMYHQYAPFFAEFQYKLREGGSLLYSWDIGMGVNFAALYAYYLASPLNWLIILCPKDFIIEFMTYFIVLKIGLSGIAFAWYLHRHCRTDGLGVGFFGIFYALSGYMAAYSWNIMWLDCIVLFPVAMLGLERLVHEKKWGMYCISLGACILSNYYISIMICIFMVLYFIALLILEKRKPFKEYMINILHFSVFSLLAGGLAAAVLLPEIYALQTTASGDFNFPQTFNAYFSIFDMLARHIGNVEVEIGLEHWPNIYCGVAVLMMFLLYLGCRTIPLKEKAVYCALLLIFLASFSINVLNFIWHGFHYPNSLPCRQSFIYIALMLMICCRAYCQLGTIPWKHVAIAFWGAVIFVLLAQKLVDNSQFNFIVFYVAILFLAVYAGLIYLWKQKKANVNVILLLALAAVSIEAAVNTTVTSVTTTSRTAYVQDNKDVVKLTQSLFPGDGFFRVEKVSRKTKNDGAWMNFPSVSLFSSTANADLSQLFERLGCEASTNAYSITGSTPLVDALLSVRYGLYSEEQEDPSLTFIGRSGDTWLYERACTLPLGFGVPFGMMEQWQLDLGNPALVQNDLCELVGTPYVLEECQGVPDAGGYYFTAPEDGDYYMYVDNTNVETVRVNWGERARTYDNVDRGYFLELGFMKAGEQVVLTCEDDPGRSVTGQVYRASQTALEELCGWLGQHPWNLTVWTDTRLEGTVEMDEAGMLFTTIPYDKGWTIWVDGQKMSGQKMAEAFLGVSVPKGKHEIVMKYMPQGLLNGAGISAGSILLILALAWGTRIRRKQALGASDQIPGNEEKEEER